MFHAPRATFSEGCLRLTLLNTSQAQGLYLQVICVSRTSKQNTVLRAQIPPKRVFVIPNGQSIRWQGCTPAFLKQSLACTAIVRPNHARQQSCLWY